MNGDRPDYHCLIVGAGFSGIGAAIKLDQEGFGDYLIVEAGDEVGGTWYWNTYPGIAVDIPSRRTSSRSSSGRTGRAPTRAAAS